MRSRCRLLRETALIAQIAQIVFLVSFFTPSLLADERVNSDAVIEGRLQSLVENLKSRMQWR